MEALTLSVPEENENAPPLPEFPLEAGGNVILRT